MKGSKNCLADALTRLRQCNVLDVAHELSNQEKTKLIAKAHEECGHAGLEPTYILLLSNSKWKGCYMDVKNFIKRCDTCIRHKRYVPNLKNYRTENLMHPFFRLGIDLVGPITGSSAGYKYLIVCTDYFTRFAITKPIKNKSAKTIAKFLFEDLFSKFGSPSILHSDRGLEFLNEIVEALCSLFRTHRSCTAAYNPKCNGVVERINGLISVRLAKLCRNNLTAWEKYVPLVTYSYNITPLKRLGVSPFFLLFNRNPPFLNDWELQNIGKLVLEDYDSYKERISDLSMYKKKLVDGSRKQEILKNQQDLRNPTFKVNDLVMVRIQKIHQKKLQNLWDGPYIVLRNCGSGGYEITDLNGHTRILNEKDLLKASQYENPKEWTSLDEGEVLEGVLTVIELKTRSKTLSKHVSDFDIKTLLK